MLLFLFLSLLLFLLLLLELFTIIITTILTTVALSELYTAACPAACATHCFLFFQPKKKEPGRACATHCLLFFFSSNRNKAGGAEAGHAGVPLQFTLVWLPQLRRRPPLSPLPGSDFLFFFLFSFGCLSSVAVHLSPHFLGLIFSPFSPFFF